MNQLPEMVRQILERLVDFFDIFDLSFFVSGAMLLAGSLYLMQSASMTWTALPIPPEWGTGFTLGAVILSCYLMGMMAFATGRWLRTLVHAIGRWVRSLFQKEAGAAEGTDAWVQRALVHHRLLDVDLYRDYKAQVGSQEEADPAFYGSLYTRLWAELRQSDSLKVSYILIRRYWVMSATYDGVAVALVYWMSIAVYTAIPKGDKAWDFGLVWLCGGLLVAFGITALACFREANRYQRYQVEEIVATLAYKHQVASLADERQARKDAP